MHNASFNYSTFSVKMHVLTFDKMNKELMHAAIQMPKDNESTIITLEDSLYKLRTLCVETWKHLDK